ncbi:hypothetical protein ACOMHN_009776 [Nucella lapillus]
MELHKALTLVDPVSSPPVTSTSLTPLHPASQHTLPPPPHAGPMAIPFQPLTVKPASAPFTYFSGFSPLGLMEPVVTSAAAVAAAAAGGLTVGGKPLTTKLRMGVTPVGVKAATERPKFAPY